MNAKILITPLLIVIVISALIWFVYPAFSNGTDGVKEKYEQLKNEKGKYEGLKSKSQNAEKLFSEISSLGADKDVLYQFIPKEIKEEEIIDNLNYLASSVGVGISQISVSQLATNAIVPSPVDSENDSGAVILPPSLPQNIEASVVLTGSYEKVKSFFEKVDKLERFASFYQLEISRVPAAGGSEIASDVLSVKTDIYFNYLKKAKLSDASASDPVFLSDKLNTDAISEIKNKKTTEVLKLDVGQKGKVNPFMP